MELLLGKIPNMVGNILEQAERWNWDLSQRHIIKNSTTCRPRYIEKLSLCGEQLGEIMWSFRITNEWIQMGWKL